MKKKALSYYLDLIKSAIDKQDWTKAKHHGEIALKKLSTLTYSPMDEYLLYVRLGFAYYALTEFSCSLDVFYKAYLIASKHHFEPVYLAYISYANGRNMLGLKNISQAVRHFQKVEEYYKKYGDNKPVMDKEKYLLTLIYLGQCYLSENLIDKAEEIIEKKLSPHQTFLSNAKSDLFLNYHHFNGQYLIAIKKYDQARQSFDECAKVYKQHNHQWGMLSINMDCAVISLLESRLNEAIRLLQSIIKDGRQLKINSVVCEAGLLLSKCYALSNMLDKSVAIEKSIKPFINKLDIIWLYEKNREFEKLYRKLQTVYQSLQSDINPISVILKQTLSKHHENLPYKIIGESASMQEIYQLIEKIAPTDLPILIQGETGTGKELIARAIHHNSLRRETPYLALNCGAVPESLLESEFFGHTKGAFTDAHHEKKGYIELASEGTFFLDEIADMSSGMQQKLLRVLEEKLIWRVGAPKPIPVNTRFIFASNRNIEEVVKAKKFREDLYYRINTIVITLPPLRERKYDIPLLINHFLSKYGRLETLRGIYPEGKETLHYVQSDIRRTQGDRPDEYRDHSEGVPIKSGRPKNLVEITPSALNLLVNYNWPGNIRELENEIKRIYTLYPESKEVTELMLSETIRNCSAFASPKRSIPFRELRKTAERNIIIETVKKCNGNISQAARMLGYDRSNFYKKMKELGIATTDLTDKNG
jgi:transcriptional regulator with PAS, ATPase and Fis domain